jgi:hypothetical protein
MTRAYYQRDINLFISDNNDEIIGILVKHYEFNLEEQQRNAWIEQIRILKNNFNGLKGHVIFEYSIPRMGKRIDCVVIAGAVVFAIEFKIGAERYDNHAIDQVLDYALDLKNFHEQSHDKIIAPVLVASKAPDSSHEIEFYEDNIIHPLKCNAFSLNKVFEKVNREIKGEEIDPAES